MNRTNVRVVALVATAALAACGGSDITLDELSEVEAQALASAIMLQTFSSAGSIAQQPQASPEGPQPAPFDYSFDFDTEVECPLGGSIALAGSLDFSGDTESEAGAFEYGLTQVHDACVVMPEEAEQAFTLWGNPHLALDFVAANDGEGVVEWSGSVTGNVEWVTEGRQGVCPIALEFGGRQEGEADLVAEMSGSVCGFAVEHELSVG